MKKSNDVVFNFTNAQLTSFWQKQNPNEEEKEKSIIDFHNFEQSLLIKDETKIQIQQGLYDGGSIEIKGIKGTDKTPTKCNFIELIPYVSIGKECNVNIHYVVTQIEMDPKHKGVDRIARQAAIDLYIAAKRKEGPIKQTSYPLTINEIKLSSVEGLLTIDIIGIDVVKP